MNMNISKEEKGYTRLKPEDSKQTIFQDNKKTYIINSHSIGSKPITENLKRLMVKEIN